MSEEMAERTNEGQRVLVIDDEGDIRDCLEALLSLEGYVVTTAASGLIAIEWAQRQPFDLVITDLRMPGMDGIETMMALKRIDPTLVVIMITGYASDESVRRLHQAGVLDCLYKPFRLEDLVARVRAALIERARASG